MDTTAIDSIYFGHIKYKASSPTLSSFAPSKILPMHDADDYPVNRLPHLHSASELESYQHVDDIQEEDEEERSLHDGDLKRFSTDELTAYDLHPPPPTVADGNAEVLAARLYSADHLNGILKDPMHFQRFRGFLNQHRQQSVPTLVRYLESQKALTAIRYANAVADRITPHSRRSSLSSGKSEAATVDMKFETFSKRAVEELVTDALPAYITNRMVTLVTECLVKEITGNNTPLMQDLVKGLAEVYCMSDPTQIDSPIVFASEGFYSTTQYGRDYAIGKNCRFLQGPKTDKAAVKRIAEALSKGQEISEILLNYRRDGSPFLNLVMMAPLMDSRGKVRYYIGAQIDISHLLEGGKGLESFKQLLDKDQNDADNANHSNPITRRPSLQILRDLGSMLNDEEIEVVRRHEARRNSRRNSIESSKSTPSATVSTRRFVGMEESTQDNIWPPTALGPSGRLPGVYQNYILVRPYPSLRIIFTSSALRIPGLAQSRLMDRIGGPQHVREGLLEALAQGVGVTAQVTWLTRARHLSVHSHDNDASNHSAEVVDLNEGKPRWLHCTPLQGSDAKPGVIMIVMVDREEITGALNSQPRNTSLRNMQSRQAPPRVEYMKEGGPQSVGAAKYSEGKLYADYLKREGRPSRKNTRVGEEEFRMGAVSSGLPTLHTPSVGGRSTGESTRSTQWEAQP